MFCKKCGSQLDEGSTICNNCGTNNMNNFYQNYSYNNPIDLTGQTSAITNKPKKNAGVLCIALLGVLAWGLLFLISYLIGKKYAETSVTGSEVLPALLLSTLPIGIIGLVISVLVGRSNNPQNGTMPSKVLVIQYLVSALAPALILCFCYSLCADSDAGALVQIAAFFTMMPMVLYFFIITLFLANQTNTKDMFSILQAYFVGFAVSGILGYLLLQLLVKLAIVFIIAILIVILFFAKGGFIYYKRR